ncbi:Hypothetical protein SMAX5B_003240 [Scophthalmus maximus]|uniref:Uncharacterized protein n=1 Tax=Scophthalmus maximus TaxID=52904 RepID=A0A2U9BEB7_SCOMX|nr:Hypothetical protein SMAX5B_003240 [Scophthalmus maximus]
MLCPTPFPRVHGFPNPPRPEKAAAGLQQTLSVTDGLTEKTAPLLDRTGKQLSGTK